jgi:hypothetical protein
VEVLASSLGHACRRPRKPVKRKSYDLDTFRAESGRMFVTAFGTFRDESHSTFLARGCPDNPIDATSIAASVSVQPRTGFASMTSGIRP